jgi:Domain of unknown function (DUF4271)
MLKIELHNRILENKDWITMLFLFCFTIIIINKTAFENKFNDFKNLWFSERYIKMYKDNTHLMTWFTFLLFLVQVISFGLFIYYIIGYFKIIDNPDIYLFIRIITFLTFFILAKFLIEKIIATSFDVEEVAEQYNMLKVSYRSYIAMILLPITIVLFYNPEPIIMVLYVILTLIASINVLIYLKGINIFQKLIIGHLFYFILYLCTLEIAPYYFMYYWFTNK